MELLEILNHVLDASYGLRQVSSATSTHPSTLKALAVINGASKDFQGTGWWFNKEFGISLAPDNQGKIVVPAETLSFVIKDTAGVCTPKGQYVKRKNSIYDSVNHTYVITTALTADITVLLDIPDLPSAAASYLKHYSAELAYGNADGDKDKTNILGNRTARAWALIKNEEYATSKTNALDSPSAQRLKYRIMQQGSPSNPMWPGG